MSHPTPSITAKREEVYLLSFPMSLSEATMIAKAFALLPHFASIELLTTTKKGERRLRYTFAEGHAKDAARAAYTEQETKKAIDQGGAYLWTRQTSLDRAAQRAECRSMGGRYYISRRLDGATGEYVHTCTCERFVFSKRPCKHTLDAIVRGRFETLFGGTGAPRTMPGVQR